MRELCIGHNDAGQRLDKFLTKALCDIPPALLYKAIRKKKIKLNRHRAEGGNLLREGDRIQLFLPDAFFPDARSDEKKQDLARIHPHLSILYEDANILLLNKRPGVLVHEDAAERGNTLLTHVQAYLFRKGEYDPDAEQSFAPALCNRIDRNTGGIVIAAKNAEALRIMNRKIRDGEVHKFYLCVVHGIPDPPSATLSAFLVKDAAANTVQIFDRRPGPDAKTIRTRYRTLACIRDRALLEVALLTGRTHQIRAHLAYIGHPLLGDGKYGINRSDRAEGYSHQALYSYRVAFSEGHDDGPLASLAGRHFSIPMEDIYFAEPFLRAGLIPFKGDSLHVQ